MNKNSGNDQTHSATDQEQPFVAHLIEMRDRLLRIVVVVLALFVVFLPFANTLYTQLAQPVIENLPGGSKLIATDVVSPIFTPIKFTLILAIFITIPYIFHQGWAFVAPGLYRHERKLALPLLVSSVGLFYAGMAFAYFVVLNMLYRFIVSFAPEAVAVMPDMARYLDFVLKLFFAFGVAFEVPVATVILVAAGVTDTKSLAAKRPYIFVGAFVVGMLLTPPDIISQTLLALPMWLLFEAGLFFARRLERERAARAADEAHEEYHPLSDEEMEAELDKAIAEEENVTGRPGNRDPEAPK
jgi:sec-independent protein translocase protein TatC